MKTLAAHVSGRLAWAALGMVLLYVALPSHQGPTYDRVVVGAHVIQEREVPSEPKLVDHVLWQFPQAEVTAVAPGGGLEAASEFCRLQVARVQHDSAAAAAAPRKEFVRSADVSKPWLPFQPSGLFVSSISSEGDLLGRDYHVHGSFGIRAEDSLVVRDQRLWPVKEVVHGLPWVGLGLGIGVLIFR